MGNAEPTAATDAYIFGVLGEVLSVASAAAVDRSGGVLGNSQVSGTFGILGYRTSASANAGVTEMPPCLQEPVDLRWVLRQQDLG
jgi:hypothetical protein